MDLMKTITDILAAINGALPQAATPAVLAVALSIMMTQAARIIAVKFYRTDAENPGLRGWQVWLTSWALTTLGFVFICMALGVEWRGTNFGVGFLAGAGGPYIVIGLRKLGIDPDAITAYIGKAMAAISKPPDPPMTPPVAPGVTP